MPQFYLDIETEGLNPKENKIVSIQYQQIFNDGKEIGDFIILKSWESSEEEIVKQFHKVFITKSNWDFIPVMTNSIFDLTFLFEKFKQYNLECPNLAKFLYDKPLIDIKYLLIMANKLQFKGSGLDQMTNKESNRKKVPKWFLDEEYKKIEDYVIQEKNAFLEFFQKIMKKLPKIIKWTIIIKNI